jgi:fibronectin-binding autotransporter adhesin
MEINLVAAIRFRMVLFSIALAMQGGGALSQTTAYWFPNATNQQWTQTPSWVGGTVPNGIGHIAHLKRDFTGTTPIVINLDVPVTLGVLSLGDVTGTTPLTISNTSVLTFNNTGFGGFAQLNKVGGGADTIQANIVLASDLMVYQTAGMTISGAISGVGRSWVKYGSGNLTLQGTNTYSGPTYLRTAGGTVILDTAVNSNGGLSSSQIFFGSDLREGNASVVIQLAKAEQINDAAIIQFESGAGRHSFLKLMGNNETVRGIIDYTREGVVQNMEGETVNTSSVLTLRTDSADSFFYGGYLRNRGSGTGTGTIGLTLDKKVGSIDAGMQTLSGDRINYSGPTTITDGTLRLLNTTNFRSNITNNDRLELAATGNWNYFNSISGSGSVIKTGTAQVLVGGGNSYGGATDIAGGTLRLEGMGTISGTSAINIKGGTLELFGFADVVTTGGATTVGSPTVTVASTTGLIVGMPVSGMNIPVGATVTAITNATNFVISAPATATGGGLSFTASGNNVTAAGGVTTSGSPNVTVASTAGLVVGMPVSGTNIPGGATITSITDGTSFVISAPATATGLTLRATSKVTATGGATTSGNTTVTVADTTGFVSGMPIYGTNIPANATISSVTNGTTFEISAPAGATGSGLTFTAAKNITTIEGATTLGSTTVTVADTTGLITGMSVFGTNIPGGATVSSVTNGTTFEISTPATATGLSFTASGNNSRRINNAAPITSQGGQIRFLNGGGTGTAIEETIGGLTLAGGQTTITTGRLGGASDAASSTLILSSLTRQPSSTINFLGTGTGPALGSGVGNRIVIPWGVRNTNDIIGGWATAGNDWAKYENILVTATGGATTLGDPTITVASTAALVAGMPVSGTNIPAGATIATIIDGTTFVISAPATATGSSLSFTARGNGTDVTTTGVQAFTAYTSAAGAWSPVAADNARLTTDTVTLTPAGTSVVNSIKFEQTAGSAVDITAGKTLRVGSGGIMTTGSFNSAISNGTLTAGQSAGVAGELFLHLRSPEGNPLTITSVIANNGAGVVSLVKTGVGEALLGAVNTYSGGTSVYQGNLIIRNNSNRLGTATGAGFLNLNGGALEITGSQTVSVTALGTSDVFTSTGHGLANGDAITFAGSTMPSGITAGTTYYVIDSLANTYRVSITPGGAFVNYTGNGSSLNFTSNVLFAANQNMTMGVSGGTLKITSGNTTINGAIGGVGGLSITGFGPGTVNLNAANTFTGPLTVNTSATVALNNTNAFTSGVTIASGQLKVNVANAIPAANALTMTGGTLELNGVNQTVSSLTGSLSSGIFISNTGVTPATLTVNQAANTTFGGIIKDVTADLNFTKRGNGTLTLSNQASEYFGITTIEAGALSVTKLDGLGQVSSIGRGNISFDSADQLFIKSGAALIYSGTGPSFTDRSFTMGTGAIGAGIYANGTSVDATVEFQQYTVFPEFIKFDAAGGAALNLGGRNTGDNIFGLSLPDNGAAAVSLDKTGTGTWILSNSSNAYSGSTTVYQGRLVITADGALGAKGGPAVSVLGGDLDLRNVIYTAAGPTTENLSLGGGRLTTTAGTSSWAGSVDIVMPSIVDVANGAQLTLGGVVRGGVGNNVTLTKSNFGTLELAGANTYGGPTIVSDGRLILNFAANAGEKLSNNASLTLGGGRQGGTLVLSGGSTGETVQSLTLARGNNIIERPTGTSKINLGAITRSGGILSLSHENIATTTTANDTSGILGAWATIGGDSWAVKAGGTGATDIVKLGVSEYILNDFSPLKHTDATANFTPTANDTRTIRFDTANDVTITLPGTSTLISGGILMSPDVGTHNNLITGGILRPGNASYNGTLLIHQNNALGGLIISSVIANNPAPTGVSGTIPSTPLNQVNITGAASLGLYPGMPISGTNIPPNATIVTVNPNSVIISANGTAGSTGVITFTAVTPVNKTGIGTALFNGLNTYAGITTVSDGVLSVGNLANGGLPSSIGVSSSAPANVVLEGGSLQYVGEPVIVDRGFTVRDFGTLGVADEDVMLTFTGNVVGDAGIGILTKEGAGTARLLRLNGTTGGAASLTGLNVSDGRVVLQYDYTTVPGDPSGPDALDRLFNPNAALTVSGGKLEVIGEDFVYDNPTASVVDGNGQSFQRFLGQFTVNAGASEVRATSREGLNPLLQQVMTLTIGNQANPLDILRSAGGTVLFVENPNGGRANILLSTVTESQGIVLPWATYLDTSVLSSGVNDFAAIEQTNDGIVSADSKSLYFVNSNPANWTNNGVQSISEEGGVPFFGSVQNVPEFKISTLRFFNDAGAGTVTIQGSNRLTLTNGAILVGANVEGNVKTITGGTLTSSYQPATGQSEMIIHNYNPKNALRIQSIVANPLIDTDGNSGTPAVVVPMSLTHTGTGTTSLFAANTYTGVTYLTGGVIRLENTNALPGGAALTGGTSALTIDGGVVGLTSASGNFNRSLGSTTAQVQWLGSGGFAAYGVDRSVNLGGASAQVKWGTGGFVPDGDTLVLSWPDSDKTLSLVNPIDLGMQERVVRVENGMAPEDARLSGTLSGAFGSFTKTGEGTLRLAVANTHSGGTTLGEGVLIAQTPTALGTGLVSMGTTSNTSSEDALNLIVEGGTVSNSMRVGNVNAAGITKIDAPADVTLTGTVSLDRRIFLGPDSPRSITVSGAGNLTGVGGVTLVDGGTLKLAGSNTYGTGASGAGQSVTGGSIIRAGTVEISNSGSLGSGAVELGDAVGALVTVNRATTGSSITLQQGTFDAVGNGIVGSTNGLGAFYDVSRTLDGATYGTGDVGQLILVKDELDQPGRNGIYRVVSVNVSGNTMNLTRADNAGVPLYGDYGSMATVQGGTYVGQTFFQATKVDAADINSDPSHWMRDVVNPNVSLLVNAPLATPVANPIDLNATVGAGTTTIGGTSTLTTGSATFSGNITMQSQIPGAETMTLALTSSTNALDGIVIGSAAGGVISEADAADTLQIKKVGAGVVTLTKANTYRGLTTVEQGVLRVTNGSSLGNASAGTLVNSGAAIEMVGPINVVDEVLELSGEGILGTGALRSVSGTNTWSGLITLAANARINSESGSTLSITNTINDVSNQNVTFGGAGDMLVSGAITTGSGSLTKDGEGTVTLSGLNTYTGTTTINAGALLVNNSNSLSSGTGTGSITINNASTLGGTGFIAPGASMDISFASTAFLSVGTPGSTVAENLDITLLSGSDLLLGGGTIQLGLFSNDPLLTSTEADRLNVANLGGGSSIVNLTGAKLIVNNVNSLAPASFNVNDSWDLFDWVGLGTGLSFTGSFSNLSPTNFTDFPDVGPGKQWDFSQLLSTGVISVVAIPEPTRGLLVMLGVLGLFFRRRRSTLSASLR